MIIDCQLKVFIRDKTSTRPFYKLDNIWERGVYEEEPERFDIKKELWVVYVHEDGEEKLVSQEIKDEEGARTYIYFANITYIYHSTDNIIYSLTTRHNI